MFLSLLTAGCSGGCAGRNAVPTPPEREERGGRTDAAAPVELPETAFVPLFDGRSLTGWRGDDELWRVEGGELVGATDGKLADNSFLVHERAHGDFVLRLRFKLRNGNSGIQFRSEELGNHVVRGYQADIADREHMGLLYDERGRGVLAQPDTAEVYRNVDLSGWNDYEIHAQGAHIVLRINGKVTVDYTERDPGARRSGVIALQLHVGPAMEVRFRDIRVSAAN